MECSRSPPGDCEVEEGSVGGIPLGNMQLVSQEKPPKTIQFLLNKHYRPKIKKRISELGNSNVTIPKRHRAQFIIPKVASKDSDPFEWEEVVSTKLENLASEVPCSGPDRFRSGESSKIPENPTGQLRSAPETGRAISRRFTRENISNASHLSESQRLQNNPSSLCNDPEVKATTSEVNTPVQKSKDIPMIRFSTSKAPPKSILKKLNTTFSLTAFGKYPNGAKEMKNGQSFSGFKKIDSIKKVNFEKTSRVYSVPKTCGGRKSMKADPFASVSLAPGKNYSKVTLEEDSSQPGEFIAD